MTTDSSNPNKASSKDQVLPDQPSSVLNTELDIEKRWLKRTRVDLDNFSFFYKKYYGKIFRYAYLKTSDLDHATDITNETFSRALENLGRFKWQGYTFGAWLFQIARNVLRQELRHRDMRSEVPYEEHVHSPIDHRTPEIFVENLEDTEILQLCVRGLNPARQDVFILYFWMGMSVKEVAASTQTPEGTVKTHLQRGRKQLLACLQKNGLKHGISGSALRLVKEASAANYGWKLVGDNDDVSTK